MNIKFIKKKQSGRNAQGKVTVRHQGAEQKRFLRVIDFKRDKRGIPGIVVAIEYDPNRTADIALVQYSDGEKRYILRPEGLNLNDKIVAGGDVDVKVGNATSMRVLPIGTVIHNVELTPGRGGQMARSAGTSAVIAAQEGGYAHLRLPSGEIRKVKNLGYATIGSLGNIDWKNVNLGKAGRKILMGIRPTVRGTAQNPRSHPHGGGEGRSGQGMSTPKTYAGRPAVGKTRKPKKYSNKYILERKKGKR